MRSFVALLGLLGVAWAAPTSAAYVPDNVVPVEWDVKAFRNGPTLRLNGTVQEVRAQLLAINPNLDSDFPAPVADAGQDLGKRANFEDSKVLCDLKMRGRYEMVGYLEAVRYLRGHGGQPLMKTGPAACGRVSCSYNSAVWLCNDNGYPKQLNGWYEVAEAIEWGHKICRAATLDGFQVFHVQNWNVIMGHDRC